MELRGLIAVGRPGWVELVLAPEPSMPTPRVLAKLVIVDDRIQVRRLIIDGEALTSTVLRGLPIGRVESIFNQHAGRPAFEMMDPDALQDFAARGILFPDQFDAVDENLNDYLAKTQRVDDRATATQPEKREPLTRPDGSDPNGFSRRVATAYNDLIRTTHRPAPIMAEEAGVPVASVHRWILEARRRGYLPPARKGRAG